MIISYDVERINKVLHDFYNSTGVRINLFDDKFFPISQNQNEMCSYCKQIQKDETHKKACIDFDNRLFQRSKRSKKTEMDICPSGLVNVVTPVIFEDTVIGYLLFGQMKTDTKFSELDSEIINSRPDVTLLEDSYSSILHFDSQKIQSISSLAKIVIRYILTENMLKLDSSEIIQKAVNFINDNLTSELSVKMISQNINVSKSALYNKFNSRFNCTIGEYINKKRVEKSLVYLKENSLSIEEVSRKSGFSSASYYTKVFKQYMGITPLKYKKM